MEKKYYVGIAFNVILTIFGLVVTIMTIARDSATVGNVISLFALIGIIGYATIGYKVPHGNLLKYTTFLFAISLIAMMYDTIGHQNHEAEIVHYVLAIGLITYIAGRFNRIEQNKWLVCVVLVLLFAAALNSYLIYNGPFVYNCIRLLPCIMWIDLCSIYFVRFKEHKEAGLQDAPALRKRHRDENKKQIDYGDEPKHRDMYK